MKTFFKNINAKILAALVAFSIVIVAGQVVACKDDVAQRIAPVGSVCIEGEECKAEEVVVAAAPKGPRSGADLNRDYCAGCHTTGIMNAPKTGSGGWASTSSKGMPAMLAIAKRGKGAMPRMGGCNDCSDEELTAVIQYMIDQ